MRPFVLSRRSFLRGTGVALALPVLDAMLDGNGLAYADGTTIPTRFGVFFFGNGVRLDRWVPSRTDASWDLSSELAPLADHKPYLNVVSGCSALASCCRGHHGGVTALLSGRQLDQLPAGNAPFASRFSGPTFDQLAAPIIGRDTLFPTLELGVSPRVLDDQGFTLKAISHKAPDAPQFPECSPAALYTRLFGSGAPDALDPRAKLRASVLDAVQEDARSLQKRLGAADRARLDQHLTSLSELRRQILVPRPECAGVTPVNSDPEPDGGAEALADVAELQMELLAAAWACDLNRVATFMFHGASSHTVFSNLGHTVEEHLLSHDSTQQEKVHEAVVWVVGRFARLLDKLKARTAGDGHLLDHAAILLTSDTAEGYTHSDLDFPIAIAGRAGGALRHPGIHFRATDERNTSDVMLALLQAVGTGFTEIGAGRGYSNTPLTEILP
jgi:hypothetical protein